MGLQMLRRNSSLILEEMFKKIGKSKMAKATEKGPQIFMVAEFMV